MEKQNRGDELLHIGLINFFSPVHMLIVTVIWFWILFFGIGMDILGYTTVPVWITILGLFPLLLSPAYAIYGIVEGICWRKERHSLLCTILSLTGLLINFVLLLGMVYLGSHF